MDITDDTVTEGVVHLSGGKFRGGGGISEPPALAPVFRSGKRVATADCCRLQGVVRQRADPMGRLPRYNDLPADRTGQASMGQAGWGWGNLTAADI